MKSLFATIFFLAFLSISAFAQTQTLKIVFINTDAFYDDKLGITKLINASKQLDAEFAVKIKELQDGNTKLQGIANELQTMQKLPQAQFNQTAYNTKQDEGERLQRELNYKKTELEAAIGKRRDVLIAPITQDIGKAVNEFSKKNAYDVIFDVAKLDNSGALLFLSEGADVTKAFITFYNTRPATPATPAKPN